MYGERKETFSYWKKPWQALLALAVGLINLLNLALNISDFREIAAVAADIMSEEAWLSYAASKLFQCTLIGFVALCFLGQFVIGCAVRSKRAADLANAVFVAVITVAWAIVVPALGLLGSAGRRILWFLLLMVMIGVGIYGFVQLRRTAE